MIFYKKFFKKGIDIIQFNDIIDLDKLQGCVKNRTYSPAFCLYTHKEKRMNSKKERKDLNTLILGVRDKSQEDFEILLEQYSPLIESCVAFYSIGTLEKYKEDFKQEATVAFYNSILSYNIAQSSVEFGLYAKICICNALNSQIRISKKFLPETPQTDLDSFEFLIGNEDPSLKVLEEERLDDLFKIIKDSLSDYEYKIWKLYFSGFSVSDIAAHLDTDSKSVSNAIYRIRVKLKASIKNN